MTAKAVGARVYTAQPLIGIATAADYRLISAKEAGLLEGWYQDAIYARPELVIGVCRGAAILPDGEQWYPWAKECPIAGGNFIDVLLVSSRGRVGIIETKLSFNPERRREVVAQVLEYALILQEAKLAALPDLPKVDEPPDAHDITDALRAGTFLLVIAGDQLDPRALRLGGAISGKHLTSEWDLVMVDLNLYKNDSAPSYLLVPEVRGMLTHEVRQVVRVKIDGEPSNTKVEVERVSDDSSQPDRIVWTANTFSDALTKAAVAPEFKTVVKEMAELAARHPGTSVRYGTGTTGSITLRRAGASVLSFWLNGRAQVKPRLYVEQALGSEGSRQYLAAIARLWGPDFVDGWAEPTREQVLQQGPQVIAALEQALTTAEGDSRMPSGPAIV